MSAERPNRTTIAVTSDLRDVLKHMARKDQSYEELITDLIKLRNDHIEKAYNERQLQQQPSTRSIDVDK